MKTLEELKKQKADNIDLIGSMLKEKSSGKLYEVLSLVILPQGEAIAITNLVDQYDAESDNFLYAVIKIGNMAGKVKVDSLDDRFEVLKKL